MIEAKVVFDGDYVTCNGYTFCFDFDLCGYALEFEHCGHLFKTLEQAIKYCMEN